MKKIITIRLAIIIFAVLASASCKKDHTTNATAFKYNGFFIINEGNYGTGTGNVSYYGYTTNTKQDSLFNKENPGKTLDPKTSTLEYGIIFNNRMYLASKSGGPFVVLDPFTLKEIARIDSNKNNDWRAFIGLSNTKGLLGSVNGVYPIDLTSLTLGTKLTTVTGETGDMIKSGDYIYVLSQTDGVVVLKTSDYSVAKKIAGISVGFAKTPDGSVWAAGGTSLIKINPATLDVTTTTLPFTVNDSWFAWHPGSIAASTKENAIYIANNGMYSGATTIYKYADGNAASLLTPFITLPADRELYGAGIAFDGTHNQLVLTAVGANYHFEINDLYFYDLAGNLKTDLPYSGFYAPAMVLFNN